MVQPGDLIQNTADYVKTKLSGAEPGHDWWHVYRVWKTACKLADAEGADRLVVELAALLHDLADSKFQPEENIDPLAEIRSFLIEQGVDHSVIEHVLQIVQWISYSRSFEEVPMRTLELDVVQDADRLDAIGAIGIARAFSYGGYKKRPMFIPGLPPRKYHSSQEYRKSNSPTINHFYEKLLLLKDKMNTSAGKKLAEERHRFLEKFLDQFFKEWGPED